jgi:tetratricopeptide (TPR) repeat protein
MSLLLLLVLYCFARAVQSPSPRKWLASAVVACLCGMATKESMAAAPILVLLYDRAFCAGTFREALQRRWRLYAALGATWLVLLGLIASTHGRGGSAGFGAGVAWWSYALTQLGAIAHYVRLALWPSPLVFDYGPKLAPPSGFALLADAAVVSALVTGALVALKRWPKAGFLGACFFAILAPTSSVVPIVTEPMVEHRMYLPLTALIVLVSAAARARFGPRGLLPLLALAPVLGVLTFERNADYRDSVALWADTWQKAPANTRALRNLADALAEHGRFQEAIARYNQVLRIEPDNPSQYNRLGLAEFSLGRLDEASSAFQQALRITPEDPDANYNLANVFLQRGQNAQAIPCYQRALAARPGFVWARVNLGNASFADGRVDDAIVQYRKALELAPDAAWVHTNLANALLKRDRRDEAIAEYRTALALDPTANGAAARLESALAAGRP